MTEETPSTNELPELDGMDFTAERWQKTVVAVSRAFDERGLCDLSVLVMFDFRAQDVTFDGSTDGSTFNYLHVGKEIAFATDGGGAPIRIYAVDGFVRGIVKGLPAEKGELLRVQLALPMEMVRLRWWAQMRYVGWFVRHLRPKETRAALGAMGMMTFVGLKRKDEEAVADDD
jgi:hypothetical protein